MALNEARLRDVHVNMMREMVEVAIKRQIAEFDAILNRQHNKFQNTV